MGWQGTTTNTTVRLNTFAWITEPNNGALRGDNATLNGSVILETNSSIGCLGGGFTVNAVISDGPGTFGFTKVGSGPVTLTATNTYEGPTIVNGGVLRCNSAASLGSGPLRINSGKLDLNFTGSNFVASLNLNGTDMTAPGTYGSTASGATFQDDTYFSGTGTVTVGTSYNQWAALNAGSASAPVNGDFNADGVANGVAYFMGVNGLATSPSVFNGSLSWPYVNSVSSYKVQTSTDLAVWTDVPSNDPNLFDTGLGGTVSYVLPTGQAKVFVRLLVTP